MSRPKWASHTGKWSPVKPSFWEIWHAQKDSLRKNGYEVRKNPNGQWEVRFTPLGKRGWPPYKPSPAWVPSGKKASVCFRCGHARIVEQDAEHKDCGMCGASVDFVPVPTGTASGPPES